MRKHLIAAAVGSLLGMPLAQAQSNVVVYGIVDLAARHVDNEGRGSVESLASGSGSTSRLGVRGVEDLGGGVSAGFHLEHGFAADTGAASGGTRFWDRRATVSVASKTYGELRLGRDFVPTYRNWTRYDPFSYVGVARSADFISNSPVGPIRAAFGSNDNTTVRSDNAVQFLLPRLGGFEGELMVGAGEGGDATAGRARLFGARLGYAAKGWGVSAATTTSENSLTGASRFRDSVVGGHVRVGVVELTAAWREMKLAGASQTNALVGAQSTFGPHVLKASYQQVDMRGVVGATRIDANDAHKLGLGYVYLLSKRTALYASAARISNDGGARFAIPGGASGLAGGASSTGYEAGVQHRF